MKKENKKLDFPMGVSQWQYWGKKWKYWDYFEDRIRHEERERVAEMIEKSINYIKKYEIGEYNNGYSQIESGECCKKCRMTNPKNPLQALVGCKNPFQMRKDYGGKKLCQCHIPFRKVAVASELQLLEELKSLLKKEGNQK